MSDSIQSIADRLLSDIKQRLQSAWDDQLSPAERDLVQQCCTDAAQLQVRALSTAFTGDAQLRMLREKAHITAQLAGIAACQSLRLLEAFWDAVKLITNGAVTIAFAVI